MADPIVVTSLDTIRQLVTEEREQAQREGYDPERLLDRKALAARLSVSVHQVDRLVRDGLPFLWVGDVKRFAWRDVREWLNRVEEPHPEPRPEC
jgi:hypothetical protein